MNQINIDILPIVVFIVFLVISLFYNDKNIRTDKSSDEQILKNPYRN